MIITTIKFIYPEGGGSGPSLFHMWKKEGIFRPSILPVQKLWNSYCADCIRNFKRKGGLLGIGSRPVCPKCGGTEWRKV